MIWYTEDMKHFKTTRYALNNRRFVVQLKSLRFCNFHMRAASRGLWIDFIPSRSSRLGMKRKRGIIKFKGGYTHNV